MKVADLNENYILFYILIQCMMSCFREKIQFQLHVNQ